MATISTGANRGGSGLAWLGLLLVIGGVAGYFVAVLSLPGLPWIRNHAIPNWLLIGAGLAVGATAARRIRRRTAKVLLGVDVAFAGMFAFMLYVMSVVPQANGPAVGTAAPEFALADQTGRVVRLAELRGAPVLLVFYRGHWCPFCVSELQGLQPSLDEFRRRGCRVFGVVVDPVATNAALARDAGLTFSILADPDLATIDAYGLRHVAGHGGGDIALSASVLIDAHGIVRWTHVTPNFRVRPLPTEILAAIDSLPKPE